MSFKLIHQKVRKKVVNQDSFWWRCSPSSCWMLSMRCCVAGGGAEDQRYQGSCLELVTFHPLFGGHEGPQTVLFRVAENHRIREKIRWIRCMMFSIVCFCWEPSHKIFIIWRYHISWVLWKPCFRVKLSEATSKPKDYSPSEGPGLSFCHNRGAVCITCWFTATLDILPKRWAPEQLKVGAVDWCWDVLAPLPFLSGYIEKEKGMPFATM